MTCWLSAPSAHISSRTMFARVHFKFKRSRFEYREKTSIVVYVFFIECHSIRYSKYAAISRLNFIHVMKLPFRDCEILWFWSYHRIPLHRTLIPDTRDNHFQILDSSRKYLLKIWIAGLVEQIFGLKSPVSLFFSFLGWFFTNRFSNIL